MAAKIADQIASFATAHPRASEPEVAQEMARLIAAGDADTLGEAFNLAATSVDQGRAFARTHAQAGDPAVAKEMARLMNHDEVGSWEEAYRRATSVVKVLQDRQAEFAAFVGLHPDADDWATQNEMAYALARDGSLTLEQAYKIADGVVSDLGFAAFAKVHPGAREPMVERLLNDMADSDPAADINDSYASALRRTDAFQDAAHPRFDEVRPVMDELLYEDRAVDLQQAYELAVADADKPASEPHVIVGDGVYRSTVDAFGESHRRFSELRDRMRQLIHSKEAKGLQQAYDIALREADSVRAEDLAQVKAFAADPAHPRFEELRLIMRDYLRSGQAVTLQQAYDMAAAANPAGKPAPPPIILPPR